MKGDTKMRQRKNHCSKRLAVTVTEVIACTSVIIVIGAITLATLGHVRGASQNDVCLNNLRRIAAASADYSANDPGGTTIPVHHRFPSGGGTVLGEYQFGGKSGNVDSTSYYIYTIHANFGTYTRPLNRLLYDVNDFISPQCRDYPNITQECIDEDQAADLAVFRCPSDTGKTGLHYTHWGASGRTAYDYFGTSYQANVMMTCAGSNGTMFSNSPFLRARDGILNPARTILYMETNGRFAWVWGYGPWGYGTTFTVHGWHGEDWRFNSAFADGRAKTITMRGAANGGVVNNFHQAEDIPGLPGGMSLWWQVIMRGPEWQLDTMPSPQIDTGKRCSSPASGDPDGPEPNILNPAELN